MSLKCVKTIIGEDLIGEVTEHLDGSISIEKPCLVMINGNGQGGFSIGLFPYLPFSAEKKYTYTRSQYLYLFDAVQDLKNEYVRLNTGIVIAQPDAANLKIIQ